ncbi:hypothetical protein BYT27DRAFT_7013659, partial [Phlegmacium glaucopus]
SPPLSSNRRDMPPHRTKVVEAGEAFNFDDVSTSSEEEAVPKKACAPHRAAASAPGPETETETTAVNPVIKPAARSNRALDVDLIFQRGRPNPSICKYCRDKHTTNPDTFLATIKWQYEPSTATSGLRNHIKKCHVDLYKQLCKEHKIDPHESIIGKSAPVGPTTLPTREPFTSKMLLQYIQNFISLNVIECPEFRQLLLLLQEDLRDQDIP